MEEAKLAILTDAKQEYSLQLINILKSSICVGIKFLYDESKKKCVAEKRFNEVLSEFQEFLSQIRLWSQDMIEQEYRRIQEESGCDFIKELITAVFMSHTQILQSIRGDGIKKQTQIDIPKPEHFIHKCYINAGREFYKNPFFFYDGPEISAIERQKNIPQCESIIATSIGETIRQLLPVRNILKTYLQDNFNQEQFDEEEKKESMKGLSQNYQNNLREIVKKEIANYTKQNTSDVARTLIEEEPQPIIEQEPSIVEEFESMPELSLDDIDIMVRKQYEKEEEMERLEREEKERLEREERDSMERKKNEERLEREAKEKLEREAKEKAEKEAREKEKAEQEAREKAEQEEREAKEKLEREEKEAREKAEQEAREAKEKAEQEAREEKERIDKEEKEKMETKNILMDSEVNKKIKNDEIMVKKEEVPSIIPVEINERSLYGSDLNFDEEINLLVDDISFDPPKKSTIPPSETKYTFFN